MLKTGQNPWVETKASSGHVDRMYLRKTTRPLPLSSPGATLELLQPSLPPTATTPTKPLLKPLKVNCLD